MQQSLRRMELVYMHGEEIEKVEVVISGDVRLSTNALSCGDFSRYLVYGHSRQYADYVDPE